MFGYWIISSSDYGDEMAHSYKAGYDCGFSAGRDLEFRTAQEHERGMSARKGGLQAESIVTSGLSIVATPHKHIDVDMYATANADVIENKKKGRKGGRKPAKSKIVDDTTDSLPLPLNDLPKKV